MEKMSEMTFDPHHGPYTNKDIITMDSGILYCALHDYKATKLKELQEALDNGYFSKVKNIAEMLEQIQGHIRIVQNRTSTPNGHYTYEMKPTFHPGKVKL